MDLKKVFEDNKTIAVYGMSANPAKPSHTVPVFLMSRGYKIYPVNPVADEIAGEKVYKNLADVPGSIDILNVFRPSDQALGVVEEAVARKNAKGDIKLIWLQEGIISDDARNLAEENGIDFIQDKCMYKEYLR